MTDQAHGGCVRSENSNNHHDSLFITPKSDDFVLGSGGEDVPSSHDSLLENGDIVLDLSAKTARLSNGKIISINNNSDCRSDMDYELSSSDEEDDFRTVKSKRKLSGSSVESSTKKTKSGSLQRHMKVSAVESGVSLKALGPIRLFNSLKKHVGNVSDVKYLRDGGLLITAGDVNSYMRLKHLLAIDKHAVKVSHHVISTPGLSGVITDIPTGTSDNEIVDALKQYGVVAAHRITKRVRGKEILTTSIKLIFSKDKLPEKIRLGYSQYTVKQYVSPVIQCYSCRHFGHYASECRSIQRCARCGEKHSTDKCSVDKNHYKCVNCGGNHSAAYGGCVRYKEAKEVNSIAATQKISFVSAKRIFSERNFASVVAGSSSCESTPPSSASKSLTPRVGSRQNNSTSVSVHGNSSTPSIAVESPVVRTAVLVSSSTQTEGVNTGTQTDPVPDILPAMNASRLMEFFIGCLSILQPDVAAKAKPLFQTLFGNVGTENSVISEVTASQEDKGSTAASDDTATNEKSIEMAVVSNCTSDTSVADPKSTDCQSVPVCDDTSGYPRVRDISRSRSRSPRKSRGMQTHPAPTQNTKKDKKGRNIRVSNKSS